VAFGEESGADELAVVVFGRETGVGFARAFPAAGNGAEVQIREAAVFRPDAGVEDSDDDVEDSDDDVEDSDDDVGAVVRFGPEAALVAEAEELRGARGMELAAAVFEDGEDERVLAYGRRRKRCRISGGCWFLR